MFGGKDRIIQSCIHAVTTDNLVTTNFELRLNGYGGPTITERDIPGGTGCRLITYNNGGQPITTCPDGGDATNCYKANNGDLCDVEGIGLETGYYARTSII